MLNGFASEYLLFVFLSTLGAVQFTAARAGLSGLLFLRQWPRATQWLAASLILGAYLWFFFWSGPRNVPDTGDGLEGNTQAVLFAIGAAAAVAATFIASSIVNYAWGAAAQADEPGQPPPPEGLGRLSRTTFARAFAARVRGLTREGR
ncbi:MAG: hypothetical protein OXI25_07065 [Chloroflexota bacterium]|nr:hypothetical protein [Chloroflexota bacterium]